MMSEVTLLVYLDQSLLHFSDLSELEFNIVRSFEQAKYLCQFLVLDGQIFDEIILFIQATA